MTVIKTGGFFYPAFHRAVKKARERDELVLYESVHVEKTLSIPDGVSVVGHKSSDKLSVKERGIAFQIEGTGKHDIYFKNMTIIIGKESNLLMLSSQFKGRVIFEDVTFVLDKKVDPRDVWPLVVSDGGVIPYVGFIDCELPFTHLTASTIHIENSEVGDLFSLETHLYANKLSVTQSTLSHTHINSLYVDGSVYCHLKEVASYGRITFQNASGGILSLAFKEPYEGFLDEFESRDKTFLKRFVDPVFEFDTLILLSVFQTPSNEQFLIEEIEYEAFISRKVSVFVFEAADIILSHLRLFRTELNAVAIGGSLRFENTIDELSWQVNELKLSNKNSESVLFEGGSFQNETALQKLDKMIGLSSVKEQVKRMVAVAKVEAEKEKRGISSSGDFSLHMVFGGAPGTGKTVVARLLGEAMYEEGILPTTRFNAVTRSDLVDDKIGGTALKTQAEIEKAIGGVLFIDEAYMLNDQSDSDFAAEAVAELIAAAEDHRDELIVIMAGYTEDMQAFFRESNPGLKSRFTNWIEFPDYSPSELFEILEFQLREAGLFYDEKTLKYLKFAFKSLLKVAFKVGGGRVDGNGRFIRNYRQEIQMALSDRVSSHLGEQHDDLFFNTITPQDIKQGTESMIKKITQV